MSGHVISFHYLLNLIGWKAVQSLEILGRRYPLAPSDTAGGLLLMRIEGGNLSMFANLGSYLGISKFTQYEHPNPLHGLL